MRRRKERKLDPEIEKIIDEYVEKIEQGELSLWQVIEIFKNIFPEEVNQNGNDFELRKASHNKDCSVQLFECTNSSGKEAAF